MSSSTFFNGDISYLWIPCLSILAIVFCSPICIWVLLFVQKVEGDKPFRSRKLHQFIRPWRSCSDFLLLWYHDQSMETRCPQHGYREQNNGLQPCIFCHRFDLLHPDKPIWLFIHSPPHCYLHLHVILQILYRPWWAFSNFSHGFRGGHQPFSESVDPGQDG